MGDPSTAVDFDATPEGHAVRFDSDGQLVGLTIVGAKRVLNERGWIEITRPERVSVEWDALEPALVA